MMRKRANLEGFMGEDAAQKAAQYDGKTSEPTLAFIEKALNDTPEPDSILDLGGGAGHYAQALAQRFDCHVKVVDYSADMLREGQRRFGDDVRLSWLCEALPELSSFPREADYPLVISLGVFQFMDGEERVASLQRCANLTSEFAHCVCVHPYPSSRPGQVELSYELFTQDIDDSRAWRIHHCEELPYPISGNNQAAQNNSQLLAFDLVKK